jgi:hypothetical protein
MQHGEHMHGGYAVGNGPDTVLLLLLGLALRRLAEQGRILRTWQAEEYTFSVGTR